MNKSQIITICELIERNIGVKVNGAYDPTEARSGLLFWFENYNRSNGPVFSIRLLGLKRHKVSLKFGSYAGPCVEHIINEATPEAILTANAFIEQLSDSWDVEINGAPCNRDWIISNDFNIEVTLKTNDQNNIESITQSVQLVMLPLIAVMAELIGYEEVEQLNDAGDFEGRISEALITKRERSSRNRLLCISIHGEHCGVCKYDLKQRYGIDIGSILEVHHIEPLSEVDALKQYNPRTDLIPLCPNCHRAIHKRKPAYTPEQLKELLDL
ncbi:MAG: hypothetical protein OFPI_00870 [Osedax symbiont Rs2]|nr:MAG: hypothetical protein OFPI_00870 [Osedax symbiont Rs2]